MAYDLDTKLSKYYTLRDLTVTNTGLSNMPNEAEYANIQWLARTLDEIFDDIGEFSIISGYRTSAVQNAIKNLDPNQPRPKSFHEAGMAVDLYPTKMSIEEFYGRILASSKWKNELGEIALKPTQNAIHLSLGIPGKRGLAMVMDEAGNYIAQTADQIQAWADPYVKSIKETFEDIFASPGESLFDFRSEKFKPGFWIVVGTLGIGGLAYLFMKKK